MSLADKIKARPENAGAAAPKSKSETIEVNEDEIKELNAELDSEIKAEGAEIVEEVELTPEQIEARTKDSYEDEIKKLREENAKRRKKEQTAKEKALAMADEVFKSERDVYETQLAEMKTQLEQLKNLKKEEAKLEDEVKDSKSSAEMELLKSELEALKEDSREAKRQMEAQRQKEEDEKDLRKQAAQNRFNSMLTEIPEEFQDYASAMFKGYSDPSEGLLALAKAKTQGLFGKKTIEVVNQIANDNNNNNQDRPLNRREKLAKRTQALGDRRKGLIPGQTL